MKKDADNHLIVKANPLICASYKLTLNEQRLILQAVSGLNSERTAQRPNFDQVSKIKITAAEFAALWKIEENKAYSSLKDATNKLYSQSIISINGKHTNKTRWVSSVEYHDTEGWAELSFSPEIHPFLTSLKKNFTKYRIGQVSNLRSTYAIRLFEWCVQFRSTGWIQLTLDEIRSRLNVDYGLYTDLKRNVIDPAITELKAKSNLAIDWKPIKDGKKVTAIRFTFKEAPQKVLDLEGLDSIAIPA